MDIIVFCPPVQEIPCSSLLEEHTRFEIEPVHEELQWLQP